jgi:protein-serine/threonine kinase
MELPDDSIDLWDYISNCGRINEVKAKIMFKQILEAILEMKENGILHFDIKDENILVDIKNEKIKIIDFGAGEYYKTDDFNDYQGLLFQLLIES